MTSDQLHFGISVPLGEDETAWQARWVEELGYEYISAGEHYMRGRPPAPSHAALPVLAVAAGATDRIRVLSSVLLAPFYHPTVLAKLAGSLDTASGGRLTLGVGVGGEFPAEFEAAGLNVKQRGRRTDECLKLLRRLWTEDNVTYQGRHFQVDDVTLNPRPTQTPHPPIWVAGRRDAAMRRARPIRRRLAALLLQPRALHRQRRQDQTLRRRGGPRHIPLPVGPLPLRLHLSDGR